MYDTRGQMWWWEDYGPSPKTIVEAPEVEWPIVEEEDGVGRCRLCGIVAVIVGDQLCGGCRPEVEGAVKVATLEVVPDRPVLGPGRPVRTHTGHESRGWFEERPVGWIDSDGDDYDLEDFADDDGTVRMRELYFVEPRCPMCREMNPVGGTTCPGAPDPIKMRNQRRHDNRAPAL